MKNLTDYTTLSAPYTELLSPNNVPIAHKPFYLRWLRFYLDFCLKYGHASDDPSSLPLFIKKLESKRQPDAYLRQANHAVNIYYQLINRHIKTGFSITPSHDTSIRHRASENHADQEGMEVKIPASPVRSGRAAAMRIEENKSAKMKTPSVAEKAAPQESPWEKTYALLQQEIELRHYSRKTLKSYSLWAHKFGRFAAPARPADISSKNLRAYLTHLTNGLKVSASTQKLAFNALLFFFKNVLKKDPGDLSNTPRPKYRQYIPPVLTREEVKTIIGILPYPFNLTAKIMYGCGLRISECMNLRMQDINSPLDLV